VLVIATSSANLIVAKLAGATVTEFGFGLPPRIFGIRRYRDENNVKWRFFWGRERREEVLRGLCLETTVYSMNWLPFGGFVSIYMARMSPLNLSPKWMKVSIEKFFRVYLPQEER